MNRIKLTLALAAACVLQLAGCRGKTGPGTTTPTIAPTAVPTATVTQTAAVTASPAAVPTASPAATAASVKATPRPTPVTVIPNGPHYINASLGLALEFPAAWEGRYTISETPTRITVYSKMVQDSGSDGVVFSIERYTGELISQRRINELANRSEILLHGNGYTYVAVLQTDLYIFDDARLDAEYKSLRGTMETVFASAKLLEAERPQAKNEGFKVVGTDFLTTEISEKWEMKVSVEAACWDLYSGSAVIGQIRLIPYGSETPPGDAETLRAYIINDFRAHASASITLSARRADSETLQKIKETR